MLCPHCLYHFHQTCSQAAINWQGTSTGWSLQTDKCPRCRKYIIDLVFNLYGPDQKYYRVYPLNITRKPAPIEVSSNIREIYTEACLVMPYSARASAALSRRCLQEILHSHGYKGHNLAVEVQQFLDEKDHAKVAPLALKDTIDAIRNFGNFSAHPITNVTSLQIIDVEPEEAEWCLEILEAMFEHFYVAPAIAAKRKEALNAKLSAAGKPLAK